MATEVLSSSGARSQCRNRDLLREWERESSQRVEELRSQETLPPSLLLSLLHAPSCTRVLLFALARQLHKACPWSSSEAQ
eukprot:4208407-Pyramimonas_sp.AAC.1